MWKMEIAKHIETIHTKTGFEVLIICKTEPMPWVLGSDIINIVIGHHMTFWQSIQWFIVQDDSHHSSPALPGQQHSAATQPSKHPYQFGNFFQDFGKKLSALTVMSS